MSIRDASQNVFQESSKSFLSRILNDDDYRKVIMLTPTLGAFHIFYTFIILIAILSEKIGYVVL